MDQKQNCTMKLVQQQNSIDCGLAVAAMLTSVDYEVADQLDPNPYANRGLWVGEMIELLKTITGKRWKAKRCPGSPLSEYAPQLGDGPTGLLIRQKGKRWGHWVIYADDRVFDPEKKVPVALSRYARRHWLVIRIISRIG